MKAQVSQATRADVSNVLSVRENKGTGIVMVFETEKAFEIAEATLDKAKIKYSSLYLTHAVVFPEGTAFLIS